MVIWAHRGASAYAPENTLAAFELAMAMGADGVELDVHLSADGELIVAHDETVDRVSDGSGLIAGMTLMQLKKLNFAARHPDLPPERVPTLAEVYALLAESGMTVNVELKTTRFAYPGIEEKCAQLAERAGMRGRVIYSSFNPDSLRRMARVDPGAPLALLTGELPDLMLIRSIGAIAAHPHYQSLYRPGAMTQLKEAGLRVHPWTIDDPADMLRLQAMGADALITNRPDLARADCTAL